MVDPAEILELLANLKGIEKVGFLDDETKDTINTLELQEEADEYSTVNFGIKEVLNRGHALYLVKNPFFRSAPEHPLRMLQGVYDDSNNNAIEVGDKSYRIIGTQINKGDEVEEKAIYISDEFVIFPKRIVRAQGFFAMVPVGFPELEDIGLEHVVSAQPSSKTHDFLRRTYGFKNQARLATLLVGYNSRTT